jgi:hypothetical protein
MWLKRTSMDPILILDAMALRPQALALRGQSSASFRFRVIFDSIGYTEVDPSLKLLAPLHRVIKVYVAKLYKREHAPPSFCSASLSASS